jgi:uncharacterized protein involved in copper resistance
MKTFFASSVVLSALFVAACTATPPASQEEGEGTMMQGDTAQGFVMDERMGHGHMDEGGMDHGSMDHGNMEHESLEVGDLEAVPTLSMAVHKDAKSGWNIEMQTTNFRFAPEHASTEHVMGEGHAHIYVDGEKINRVYSNWYHVSGLTVGSHEIRVTLNANSHDDFVVDGEPIAASETVIVE